MLLSAVLGLVLAATQVLSAPSNSKQKVCTVKSSYKSSNGTADDSPAVLKAFAECSTDSLIHFQEGVDYNILQPVSATNLSNVEISMLGNLHLPQNISTVQ